MPKKRRTRQHVIAELSANHVERYALLCGYSVERVEHDYGIDLILFTYDDNGEIENGQIFIQLKATDSLRVLGDQETISFSVERSDLELRVPNAVRLAWSLRTALLKSRLHERVPGTRDHEHRQPTVEW